MKSTSTYTTMMRVTPGGRPFASDLHDIFAAMIFQIKVGDHRSLFRTYPASFTTDNMIEVLDHLQFTHVLRQPDPHDPHKQLETKTITTFSMTRTMAKQLGQHFLTARLIESASDPTGTRTMKDRSIWTVTSKGKWMVYNFAERGHVAWNEQSHTSMALKVVPDRKVVLLDRRDFVHPSSHEISSNNHMSGSSGSSINSIGGGNKNDMDAISFERPNMTEAFKSMMEHLETSQLLADDVGGIGTQQMVTYTHTFFGYHVVEYIIQFMSVVNRDEADMVASEFVLYGWISQVLDKSDRANNVKSDLQFKSQRNVIYALTDRGRLALGWEQSHSRESRLAPPPPPPSSGSSSHSNSSNNKKHQPQHSLISDAASTMSSSSLVSFASSASSSSNSSSSPLQQQKKADSTHQRQPMSVTTSSLWLDPASGTESSSTSSVSPVAITRGSSVLVPLPRISNTSSHYTRLQPILEDPLLRMYFREFLKQNFCEENLHFWVDYRNMLYHHHQQQKTSNSSTTTSSSDKETSTNSNSSTTSSSTTTDYNRILSECYAMYVTYIAPQATMELNIDHSLHQDVIKFVEEAFKVVNTNNSSSSTNNNSGSSSSSGNNNVNHIAEKRPQQSLPFFYTPTHPSQEQQTIIMVTGHRSQCLKTLLAMYERVHDQICRIMAEDSLPRFLKSPRYVQWQQRQRERQQELEQQQQMDQALSERKYSSSSVNDSTPSDCPSPTNQSSITSSDTTKNDDEKKNGKNPMNKDDNDENTDALHKELDRLTLTGVATTATTTTTTTTTSNPSSNPTGTTQTAPPQPKTS
ncbi:hypothetical protein BCR42DRAFT_486028 [Absidia repens]|uniref:Regulator of G protein signaling domain-domain-containing protein n=1 Tax=Absidia repens TaxID=90262 RepID=A0A1X2J2C6_9FUNG|nr:hypothetical protein BCR42DRAFT_486028 [Absidia repens]